jgi:transposase
MATEALWAGLDLGLRQTRVCIVDDAGAILREETCETSLDEILRALATADGVYLSLVATEAGSDTHIVRKLREAGVPVALFESRKASRFLAIRRSKTDASDAHGLADLARLGRHTVSQVHLKSLECQQLRSQLAMRHRLVRVRVAVEGAIRSRLALYGRSLSKQYSAELLRERVTFELAQLKAEDGIDLGDDLEPLLDVAHSLRKYIGKLDRRLKKIANDHPVCRRLMAIIGVGPICSLSFYSAIEDPRRFRRTSDVAAYLGLVPRRHQSGDVSYTRGITKTGNTMTRSHLVNAAVVFGSKGPDSALKSWATSLRERVGARRARVALARKLSILLLTIWKTGATFEPYPSRRVGKHSPVSGE